MADIVCANAGGLGVSTRLRDLGNGYYAPEVIAQLEAGSVSIGSISGSHTPSDAYANPTDALNSASLNSTWNGTTWDRMRSAGTAANTTGTGLLGCGNLVFDGTNWQSVRTVGDNSDAQAASANGDTKSVARNFGYNNATWDRLRNAAAANLAAQSGLGVQLVAHPGFWTVNSFPGTATVASAVKGAGAAGVRHICAGVSFGFAQPTATPVAFTGNVQILDGATVIWQQAFAVAATASQSWQVNVTGLSLVGTAATSMTAQFSAAGGTATQESAVLMGYDAS